MRAALLALALCGSAHAQSVISGGLPAPVAAQTLSGLGAAASGANTDITSLAGLTTMKFGATGTAVSSAPVMHVCGPIIVGTLASGATFLSFTPDAPITLIRLTTTISVVGVIGAGDAVKCNNAAGSGLTATSSAGAAVGTVTTTSGAVNIAYQGTVSCHIDSTATTRPIENVCLEYVLQ